MNCLFCRGESAERARAGGFGRVWLLFPLAFEVGRAGVSGSGSVSAKHLKVFINITRYSKKVDGRASSTSLFQTSSMGLFVRECVCVYARDVAWMERYVCVVWCDVFLVFGVGVGFDYLAAFLERIVASGYFSGSRFSDGTTREWPFFCSFFLLVDSVAFVRFDASFFFGFRFSSMELFYGFHIVAYIYSTQGWVSF